MMNLASLILSLLFITSTFLGQGKVSRSSNINCKEYLAESQKAVDNGDYEIALNILNRGLKNFKGDSSIYLYGEKGEIYYSLNKTDSSIYYFDLSIRNNLIDKKLKIESFLNLSLCYTSRLNDIKTAIVYSDSAEILLTQNDSNLNLYHAYCKGIALIQVSLYDEALKVLLEKKAFFLDKFYYASHYLRCLAVVYERIEEDSLANHHHELSYALDSLRYLESPNFNHLRNLSFTTYNKSIIYLNNRPSKSIYYLKLAIEYADKSKNKKVKNKASITLAKAYQQLGNKKACDSIIAIINYEELSLINKFYYWQTICDINRFELISIESVKELIEKGFEAKLFERIANLSESISNHYLKTNNTQLSLSFVESRSKAEDSIKVDEIKRNALKIELAEIIKLRENNNRLLSTEVTTQKAQKNRWIWLTILLIIIGLIITFYLRKKTILAKQKASSIKLEKEKIAKNLSHAELEKQRLMLQVQKNKLSSTEVKTRIENLKDQLKQKNDWVAFVSEFEILYPNFLTRLQEKTPVNLSQNDLRLATLIRLNLSNKEVAEHIFISYEGAKKARLRLAKKFNLSTGKELAQFIQNI